MLYVILVLVFIFSFIGMYRVLCEICKMPRTKTFKKKTKIEIKGVLDDLEIKVVEWLSVHIVLTKYRKDKIEEKLSLLNITKTAEYYVAECVSKGLLFIIVGIVFLFISKTMGIGLLVAGVVIITNEMLQLNKKLDEKRVHIERGGLTKVFIICYTSI